MQSKWQSALETCANVFSGMLLGFCISQAAFLGQDYIKLIYPGFEWTISAGSNVVVTVVLTLVSLARSYFWRRHFNRKEQK